MSETGSKQAYKTLDGKREENKPLEKPNVD
jgi:hypothetical protein